MNLCKDFNGRLGVVGLFIPRIGQQHCKLKVAVHFTFKVACTSHGFASGFVGGAVAAIVRYYKLMKGLQK